MILTSLTLKDWKHLKHIKLSDLAPGINVIHGPNKVGKSTLAEAVRIALVDYDHESGHREVVALTPFADNSAVPTAQIGFLVKDQPWTVEKRFTKRKGGGAELREGESAQPKAEGKNVTTEVVRLLGITKSNEGLGALLWPKQGNAELPDVDQPLGDALRQLLGVQISQGDVGFQGVLDKRLESWFTPKGKPNKDVTNRDESVERQQQTVAELRDSRQHRDELVREHTEKKTRHLAAHKDVEETRKAIDELEPRVKALDKRKQQLKDIERQQTENASQQESVKNELQGLGDKIEAVKQAEARAAEAAKAVEPLKLALEARQDDLKQAEGAVAALEPQVRALQSRERDIKDIEGRQEQNTKEQKIAQADLADLKKKVEEVKRAEKAANEAAIGVEPLKQALGRTGAALEEAAKAVGQVEADDTKLRQQEARSMALRELKDLEGALPGKREDLTRARETEQRLADLRTELAAIGPCDEADKQHLEQMLEDLREVEAGLRAAAITVTLTPDADMRVGVHVYGEAGEEGLAAGAPHDVTVLQNAELRLDGWGTVRVKRGETTGTLAEQRNQRDDLLAERDGLRAKLALGEIEQGKWLSELASRAATRESRDKEAKKLAKELKKQAPDGVEALAAGLQQEEARLGERKQAAGLDANASAAEALAALGNLAARRSEMDAALNRTRQERTKAQEAQSEAADKYNEAEKKSGDLQGKVQAARGLLEDAQQRTGGEIGLNTKLAKLNEAARQLDKELDKAQLTEAEMRLPDELEAARNARNAAQEEVDEADAAYKTAVESHEMEKSNAQATRAVLNAEIKRTGGEEVLRKRLEELAGVATKLQEELWGQRLTPEEELLEEKLSNEREAIRTREKREREISDRLKQIEGELSRFEGLHGRLMAAEQKLASMEAARERERLDAEAHKLIADWFKEERDKATERSLAPVSEHVQRWLRILNNADGASVEFSGSSLKAEALRVGDQNLPLDTATSYGEREQLGTLVRLAYACVLAKDEPQAVILDDPLAHSDSARHRRMLDVLADASKRNLQIIVLTCHPERFDQLKDAKHFDLELAKTAGAGGTPALP